MSLQYILDGYNIVKQNPALCRKATQAGRQGLYALLEAFNPQGSFRNKVTIVFDGQEGASSTDRSSFNVVFSKGRSADEEIKAMVARAKNPACLVVVSDDRLLCLESRSLGARIMGVKEFLAKPAGRPACRQAGVRQRQEAKDISFTARHKITSEMSKIWLKK